MANVGRGIGGAAQGAAGGAAIGGPIGGAIGGLAGLIGGLFSGGNDAEDQMAALQQQAMDAIKNVDIPKLQQLQVQLQPYKEAGLLSPELEATVYQPDSMMNQVSTDPRLKDAQMIALGNLQKMSTGGLNMSDKSMLDQIQRNSANSERAKESQILQEMQQRGQAGSGAELASRLSSAQNSANNAGSQGLQVGATATQRALESLMNSGQLGGQIRSQDFGEQAQKAQSQDVINQFNARNRQAVIGQNTQTQNAAQAANLANKQDIMNKNTGIANQQSEHNAQAVQQNYENNLRKAQGIYSANNAQAGNLLAQQQRSNDAFSGTMSGIAGAAGAYGAYQNNQNLLDLMKQHYGYGSGTDAPTAGVAPKSVTDYGGGTGYGFDFKGAGNVNY
jgi:hypothetical protein